MSNLPRISGRTCVKALAAAGFIVLRQHGSHLILRRQEPFTQVVVPDHLELDRGTLRAIMRQTGMTIDQFKKLL
jgi:predicted RNA binding protein YcfA (HicA-like mRNA interferase family)